LIACTSYIFSAGKGLSCQANYMVITKEKGIRRYLCAYLHKTKRKKRRRKRKRRRKSAWIKIWILYWARRRHVQSLS